MTTLDTANHWRDIDPADAKEITLPYKRGATLITGPLNSLGERCPWPWDPQQLKGAPMGMYHCPYCGEMEIAGLTHSDWDTIDWSALENTPQPTHEGDDLW